MQLDRTFIAIRKRTLIELWDLTLQVLRRHFFALAILLLVGALPWFLLNFALTWWMVGESQFEEYVYWFYWVNICLVTSQAQVATSYISSYLGHAMFDENPQISTAFRDVRERGAWFWWLHLVNRMVFPVVGVVAMGAMAKGTDAVTLVWGLLLCGPVALGLLIRSRTPYMNELLLLEKAPRMDDLGSSSVQISYNARSRGLHSVIGADLVSRFLLAGVVAAGLAYSVFATLYIGAQALNLDTILENGALVHYLWQPALWVAAGFVAVNRFLAYIDLRIRTEGWSVMLSMKAEANRQKAETAIG